MYFPDIRLSFTTDILIDILSKLFVLGGLEDIGLRTWD